MTSEREGRVRPLGRGKLNGHTFQSGGVTVELLTLGREARVMLTGVTGVTGVAGVAGRVIPASEWDGVGEPDVLIRNIPRNRSASLELDASGQLWLNLPRGWWLRVVEGS